MSNRRNMRARRRRRGWFPGIFNMPETTQCITSAFNSPTLKDMEEAIKSMELNPPIIKKIKVRPEAYAELIKDTSVIYRKSLPWFGVPVIIDKYLKSPFEVVY